MILAKALSSDTPSTILHALLLLVRLALEEPIGRDLFSEARTRACEEPSIC